MKLSTIAALAKGIKNRDDQGGGIKGAFKATVKGITGNDELDLQKQINVNLEKIVENTAIKQPVKVGELPVPDVEQKRNKIMAKLEQKARKGLYGGFKPGSTGGPGTGKFKNTVKRKANDLKRGVGDVASNVKEKIKSSRTPEEPTLTINTSDNSNTTIGRDTSPSASDRYNEIMLGQPLADPNAYAAALAGGSRPMTAMDNPQIDLTTGMPMTPGGQANMNPNFIGDMANSNMPTTSMLAQDKAMPTGTAGKGIRSLAPSVQENMGYDPLSQERLTQSRRSTKCMRVKKK